MEPTILQIMLPAAASPSTRKGTVSVRGSEAAEHFFAATNNKHTQTLWNPKRTVSHPRRKKRCPRTNVKRCRERATRGTVVDVQSKPRSRKQSTLKEKRQECPRARAFAIARADSHRMGREKRSAQAHSRAWLVTGDMYLRPCQRLDRRLRKPELLSSDSAWECGRGRDATFLHAKTK